MRWERSPRAAHPIADRLGTGGVHDDAASDIAGRRCNANCLRISEPLLHDLPDGDSDAAAGYADHHCGGDQQRHGIAERHAVDNSDSNHLRRSRRTRR